MEGDVWRERGDEGLVTALLIASLHAIAATGMYEDSVARLLSAHPGCVQTEGEAVPLKKVCKIYSHSNVTCSSNTKGNKFTQVVRKYDVMLTSKQSHTSLLKPTSSDVNNPRHVEHAYYNLTPLC